MTRMRRGRRTLAVLTTVVVAACLIGSDRPGRAEEIQALTEGQLTDEATVLQSVILKWTAPGDDGLYGRAARYDLRYSSSNIVGTDTLGWWNRATQVNLWNKAPSQPGMPDSVRVLGFTPGYRYYAMLRTCDEVPNWSPYSNIATILATDLQSPQAVRDLKVSH